jgi:hypothetical protein
MRLGYKVDSSGRGHVQLFTGGKVSGGMAVRGLAEIETKLLAIGRLPATDAGREALWHAARPLVEAIAAAAPVNAAGPTRKSWRTGRKAKGKSGGFYGTLRENIRRGVVLNAPNGTVMAQVGTGDAFWGLFTERGTVNRRLKLNGTNRGRVAGSNWMARAFQHAVPAALAQVSARMERAIENAARRQSRGLLSIPGIWAKVYRP